MAAIKKGKIDVGPKGTWVTANLVNLRSNLIPQGARRTTKKVKGIAIFRKNPNMKRMLSEYLHSGRFYISGNLALVPATQVSSCNRCANIR